eukprot:3803504-Prymnesium_polylepis.1
MSPSKGKARAISVCSIPSRSTLVRNVSRSTSHREHRVANVVAWSSAPSASSSTTTSGSSASARRLRARRTPPTTSISSRRCRRCRKSSRLGFTSFMCTRKPRSVAAALDGSSGSTMAVPPLSSQLAGGAIGVGTM